MDITGSYAFFNDMNIRGTFLLPIVKATLFPANYHNLQENFSLVDSIRDSSWRSSELRKN